MNAGDGRRRSDWLIRRRAAYQRTRPRAVVARPITLRIDDALPPLDVTVEDSSVTGFRFFSALPVSVGTPVTVGLAGSGRADAEVAWRQGTRHGCLFTSPLTPAAIEAAFTNAVTGAPATITSRAAMLPITTTARTAPAWQVAQPARFVLASLTGALIWAALVIGLHVS